MMAHTPGPWEFVEADYGYSTLWNPETRQEILTTSGRNEGDHPRVWMGEELTPDDKALILAAPTLADALREARTTLSVCRTQIMVELNRGVDRWEGVPEKLKERLDRIDAALKAAGVADG